MSENQEPINDETIMAFGKHQGKRLIDVPAIDLLWLFKNERAGRYTQYIKDNMDVLKKQAEGQGVNDNTVMSFGKHKGRRLGDVPAQDLIWLYENNLSGRYTGYIQKNWDVLEQQARQERNNR